MNHPQRAVDVLEHADSIGDDDVIERPIDRSQNVRIFDVAQHKIEIGTTGIRFRNRLGTEIDADAKRRLQRSEQIAAAAAQFQYPLAGRNQEAHELVVVFVIGSVEFSPAVEFVDIGLVMITQITFALTGKLQRSSGVGSLQIHDSCRQKYRNASGRAAATRKCRRLTPIIPCVRRLQ